MCSVALSESGPDEYGGEVASDRECDDNPYDDRQGLVFQQVLAAGERAHNADSVTREHGMDLLSVATVGNVAVCFAEMISK